MPIHASAAVSWETAYAEALFADIGRDSADAAGVSRPAYSDIESRTIAYLARCAEAEGLVTEYDPGRNLIISLPEHRNADRYVLLGSHVDSVPQGGNFDGLSGVIAGLICLVRARRQNVVPAVPVKVIALRGEESSWFGPCYAGSKALLGQLEAGEAAARHRGDGRTLLEHMASVGVDTAKVARREPLIDPRRILTYLELHIEQGPLLVESGLPAAVVTGIRGNFRHRRIACIGEAGHSGAVPRAFRHDPVLAMASLLNDLDRHWIDVLDHGGDLAVTVGTVATDPEVSVLSRIPDRVEFSLDVRSQDVGVLDDTRDWLEQALSDVGRSRQVVFELDRELSTAPALCAPEVVAGLSAAQLRAGQAVFTMASGGGHDAAVFANAGIPTGMVFVRNVGGSHNPNEQMDVADLIAGTDILCGYIGVPA
ncbi:Zn-dependent hydrolase [Devosia riboflavina]|nr:Zn-dependent hydrolase [Devosia riboflavina]